MNTFSQMKWKLLVTYLAVAAVCLSVVIAVTRELTVNAYSRHVSSMAVGGMGSMMSTAMAADLDQVFRDILNASLVWGGLSAVVIAVILSLIISRRITKPIHEMAAVTGRIAEGDYSRRVTIESRDEIGSLARSLNLMAENLQESQKLRRELMANIAHELRTPLTSISGYMEGLIDGVVPATEETYELVHREAGRLSRLVNDLQRLSRAESGKEKLDIIPLQAQTVLDRLSRRLEPQFRDKGVDLSVDIDPGAPPVLADEDKLDQVLTNLIDNALRYTDAGGKVTVEVHGQDGKVAVTVADTGIGIGAEDLPHIFERFYRADKSRSRERGGTGIGLTIAKRYVEALGGTISVSSAPAKGTRFSVLLPSSAS
ncbi:MAG: cell wall metabolism sensor histidine kinase WalK [Actinobacteria bacterium]|nr:cell wall metabolism sensor histidine kinase WalK [Actinomycetota bacterium]